MEPILIPSVPSTAFNKHRRISDLIRKQVEHFNHVEARLPKDVRAKLPQGEINTEGEAARYISAITSYLLSRPRLKPVAKKAVAIKPPAAIHPNQPLALAAAAEPAAKKSAAKKKSASQKSASKKEAPKVKESLPINSKANKSSPKREK